MFDGRGRYIRLGAKTLLSELLMLDMRDFNQRVGVTGYAMGLWSWTTGRGRESSIGYQVKPNEGVRLYYTLGKTEQLDYLARVTTTRCNLGGVRYWWVCPRCGRRCRVLYCNRLFVCRQCNPGAYYETQKSKDPLTRIDNELTSIRRRLKAKKTLATTDRLPDKPRRMHLRTYMRLGDRYHHLQLCRTLSIGIDIARMGETLGIRSKFDADDLTEYLKEYMRL